jgi:hypothetical protein
MVERFDDARIDGGFIRELAFVPSKTVRLNILRSPKDAAERQVSILRDLLFHEVQECHCNFDAKPWLEITSHATLLRSDLLTHYQATRGQTRTTPEVLHFQITCDEGRIDIIARGFTTSVVEEIPHHGSSESLPLD